MHELVLISKTTSSNVTSMYEFVSQINDVSCGDWEEEEIQEEDNSSPDPTREDTKRTRSLVHSPDKMIEN